MLTHTRMRLPVSRATSSASSQERWNTTRQGLFQSSAVGAAQVVSRVPVICGGPPGVPPRGSPCAARGRAGCERKASSDARSENTVGSDTVEGARVMERAGEGGPQATALGGAWRGGRKHRAELERGPPRRVARGKRRLTVGRGAQASQIHARVRRAERALRSGARASMLFSSVYSPRAAHERTRCLHGGSLGLALALLALVSAAGAQESGAQDSGTQGRLVFPAQLVTSAEDLGGSGLAFVELESARDTYLLGEPIELTLRFGLQPAFLRENLVQLFPRPLDVPVQLFVPVFEEREGLRLRAAAEPAGGSSVALGEAIVRATPTGERERGGRTYATFELVRTVLAT